MAAHISATGYCHIGKHAMCFADGDCECSCHLPPIARNSDPETSHEAAETITKSGKRGNLCNDFMELIERNPGLTVGELALLVNMLASVSTRPTFGGIKMEVEQISMIQFWESRDKARRTGAGAGRPASQESKIIKEIQEGTAIILSHGSLHCSHGGSSCGIKQIATNLGKKLGRLYRTTHLSDGRVAIACFALEATE